MKEIAALSRHVFHMTEVRTPSSPPCSGLPFSPRTQPCDHRSRHHPASNITSHQQMFGKRYSNLDQCMNTANM